MKNYDNILDFEYAFKKKNRMKKQLAKKKSSRAKKDVAYSHHALEQIEERKLGRNRVEKCLQKGRKVEMHGAVHYILENLHVVLNITENLVLTAYNSSDMREDLAA